MKYVNCPICEWTLGVPGKLLGQPVNCPKCDHKFLASEENATDDKPAKKKRKKNGSKAPSSSTLPAPQLSSRVHEASSVSSDFEPPQKSHEGGEIPDPPKASGNRLRSPHRDTEDKTSSPTTLSASLSPPPPAAKKQVTAKIIQAEAEPEEFGKDGELPTLQLKDNAQKKDDKGELKSRPVFLGLVICASVLSSGLMLFFADFSPKVDEATLNNAREEIRRFYSVRPDVELKPYQLELREAQLAHSRNDRKGEIAAYRKVMNRFRAEDKSKFVGVTGSPGADVELERLVSILLGDGKIETNR